MVYPYLKVTNLEQKQKKGKYNPDFVTNSYKSGTNLHILLKADKNNDNS